MTSGIRRKTRSDASISAAADRGVFVHAEAAQRYRRAVQEQAAVRHLDRADADREEVLIRAAAARGRRWGR
jgi:hypothetical protein